VFDCVEEMGGVDEIVDVLYDVRDEDANWLYVVRGWPRMRPSRVSCAFISALYAATFSLS